MGESVCYKKGDVIFRENQWEMRFYEIVSGCVGIYSDYGKEDEKLLAELGAGKIFGEMGVIEARPRSATAVALEDVTAETVSGDEFSDYFKNSPKKASALIRNTASRLRELSAEYVDTCGTIAEYLENENTKKKHGEGLLGRIKKLMDYSDSVKENCPDTFRQD